MARRCTVKDENQLEFFEEDGVLYFPLPCVLRMSREELKDFVAECVSLKWFRGAILALFDEVERLSDF